MKKALLGGVICDYHQLIKDGYLIFENRILEVGAMKDYKDSVYFKQCEERYVGGMLILPGLVNLHIHLYAFIARGINLPFDPMCFKDILTQLWWRVDGAMTQKEVEAAAYAGGKAMLLAGVTSIVDHHASGRDISGSLETIKKAVGYDLGLRVSTCFEVSDRYPVELALKENQENMMEEARHLRQGLFGLHASMSLSEETLNKISRLDGNNPIHIHLAESREDVTDCKDKYQETITERLLRHGLLKDHSLMVHGCHLSHLEMDLLAEAGCYLVVNPTSNMNNGVGLPDVKQMMQRGIKVMIGNDGIGPGMAGEWRQLFFAMHHHYKDPTLFTLSDLRTLITNGYDYISWLMGLKVGRFLKDYEADLLVIPYETPTAINEENIMAHLVYGVFDGFKPKEVYLGGRQMVALGKLVQPSTYSREELVEISTSFWQQVEKEGYNGY